jgi:hypothetical protein
LEKRVEQVLPGSGWWGEVAQTMYTNVSEYKNDKMKGEKKKNTHTKRKISGLCGLILVK